LIVVVPQNKWTTTSNQNPWKKIEEKEKASKQPISSFSSSRLFQASLEAAERCFPDCFATNNLEARSVVDKR